MLSTKELIELSKNSFNDFSYRDWCDYYNSLNQEKAPDECPVKLGKNEKLCYEHDLEKLKSERAKHPGVPISYEMPKYSWFE